MLLTVIFIKYFNRNKLGHGITNVLYCISQKSSFMEKDKMYSHMVSSALTVGFGGSAGLEAPIITTGSAIGSNLGSMFHLNYKQRTLLIGCGAAGATAGIFNSPIAGVVFVLEILLLDLSVSSFIPLLISSVAGAVMAKFLLGEQILFAFVVKDVFTISQIPLYIVLGILAGVFSIYFTRLTISTETFLLRYKSRFSKATYGGLLLGALIFVLPPLYGEGYVVLKDLLTGNEQNLLSKSLFAGWADNAWLLLVFLVAAMVMKVVATSLTLGGGGSGGIFAPSIFVGGFMGFCLARLINLSFVPFSISETNFALVGMAGIISGVMHAPLTAIFLIFEITSSYELILPLMIVAAIAYATISYFEPYSIYASQLARKGHLISHDKDKEVLTRMKLERVIETDLVTILPDASLQELINKILSTKRNIFPVIDDEGHLKGIITLDDIREIMFRHEMYENVKVNQLMRPAPAIVSRGESMADVMKKFDETGAWNLPVIDDGKYLGFLSKSKIFSIYRRLLIDQSKE